MTRTRTEYFTAEGAESAEKDEESEEQDFYPELCLFLCVLRALRGELFSHLR
jgi:hypothetical protein